MGVSFAHLQFLTNLFEPLQAFFTWSEDVHTIKPV